MIAAVACLLSNAAYIGRIAQAALWPHAEGLSKQALRIYRGRVRDFEQLFGCTLFDD